MPAWSVPGSQSAPAFEPGAPDQDVLQRVVEHMAHREHAGDVRRRDDDL
jgi:hypothetical protein